MPDEKIDPQPIDAQPVDKIDPATVDAIAAMDDSSPLSKTKVYTDERGGKVVIEKGDLEAEALKEAKPEKLDSILNVAELKTGKFCNNCRFWSAVEFAKSNSGYSVGIEGECRVNAPRIVLVQDVPRGTFPLIGPYQWCGKYEKNS